MLVLINVEKHSVWASFAFPYVSAGGKKFGHQEIS